MEKEKRKLIEELRELTKDLQNRRTPSSAAASTAALVTATQIQSLVERMLDRRDERFTELMKKMAPQTQPAQAQPQPQPTPAVDPVSLGALTEAVKQLSDEMKGAINALAGTQLQAAQAQEAQAQAAQAQAAQARADAAQAQAQAAEAQAQAAQAAQARVDAAQAQAQAAAAQAQAAGAQAPDVATPPPARSGQNWFPYLDYLTSSADSYALSISKVAQTAARYIKGKVDDDQAAKVVSRIVKAWSEHRKLLAELKEREAIQKKRDEKEKKKSDELNRANFTVDDITAHAYKDLKRFVSAVAADSQEPQANLLSAVAFEDREDKTTKEHDIKDMLSATVQQQVARVLADLRRRYPRRFTGLTADHVYTCENPDVFANLAACVGSYIVRQRIVSSKRYYTTRQTDQISAVIADLMSYFSTVYWRNGKFVKAPEETRMLPRKRFFGL